MICYHHTDLDGMSAAYCVYKYAPNIDKGAHSFYARNYNDKFDKHVERDDVVIVDISISEHTYKSLLDICKVARSVTWIDHHITSIDTIEKHKEELQSIDNLTYFISTEACGALLAYAYFNIPTGELAKIRKTEKNEMYDISAKYNEKTITVTGTKEKEWFSETIDIPEWLFYVDDHDCWKKKDPNSDLYHLGAMSEDIRFVIRDDNIEMINPFWEYEKFMNTKDLILAGGFINKYTHSIYNKELSSTFEWEYNDITFLCKNGTGGSYNFEHMIEKYPAVILFRYDGRSGMWVYSVYASEKSNFNCKEFCEKFGGGGHLKAAGFSTKMCMFTHKPNIKGLKDRIIFLGGTTSGEDWRSEFISIWKKISKDNERINDIELFNPVVSDWTEDCKIKEDEVKDKALMNLFVLTPDSYGNITSSYSIAEAIEMSHSSDVFLAIYDKENNLSNATMKSVRAIGSIIKEHGGKYKTYFGLNSIEELVEDVIEAI